MDYENIGNKSENIQKKIELCIKMHANSEKCLQNGNKWDIIIIRGF